MTGTVLAALVGGAAFAQDGFFRGRGRFNPVPAEARVEYDGRFSFVRLRYQGGFRRDPGWAHDYPRADWHFQRILEDITFTRTLRDESNILSLDDPDLGLYPVVYMSEPGFWTLNDAETDGLRAYLQKGGFIIFDDFRGPQHWSNLQARMAEVLPEARWVPLDASHPVFHSFFDINALVTEGYYGEAAFLGIFEDNDPRKRLLAVANYNHDLGELWEFSDTGWMPVDLSNEAYKYGVNYVIYAMTH
ncbi:MAG: DUF4159 domain-containing protein [Vicinamibacterales bacterium]